MWYKLRFKSVVMPKFIKRYDYLGLLSVDKYNYTKVNLSDDIEEETVEEHSDPQNSSLAMGYDDSPNNLNRFVEQQELRELNFGTPEYPFCD